MYFSPAAKAALGSIDILLFLNLFLYLRSRKSKVNSKYRLYNLLNRILFLIYLVFYYLHWPYRSVLLYAFSSIALWLFIVEVLFFRKRTKNKFNAYSIAGADLQFLTLKK